MLLLPAVVALWIAERMHWDGGFRTTSTCLLQFGMQTFQYELVLRFSHLPPKDLVYNSLSSPNPQLVWKTFILHLFIHSASPKLYPCVKIFKTPRLYVQTHLCPQRRLQECLFEKHQLKNLESCSVKVPSHVNHPMQSSVGFHLHIKEK